MPGRPPRRANVERLLRHAQRNAQNGMGRTLRSHFTRTTRLTLERETGSSADEGRLGQMTLPACSSHLALRERRGRQRATAVVVRRESAGVSSVRPEEVGDHSRHRHNLRARCRMRTRTQDRRPVRHARREESSPGSSSSAQGASTTDVRSDTPRASSPAARGHVSDTPVRTASRLVRKAR